MYKVKQEIDYDMLKDVFKNIRKQNISSSGNTFIKKAIGGMFEDRISIIGAPPTSFPESILGQLMDEVIKRIIKKIFSDPAEFSDDDLKNIEHLIQEGYRQGLKEMEIRISKDLGAKIGLSVNLPIDTPVGTSLNISRENNGDYIIHVKFNSISYKQDIEAIKEYHKLMEQGILTKEEFEKKKTEILSKNNT